jgi:hypothetical protein
MSVKDLEGVLHYKQKETPYPYHDIPENVFGIEAREASWIIDIKALGKNAIVNLGAGHLNSIATNELKETFVILPINCTCDKRYSDTLSITSSNFIGFERNLIHLTFDEIIDIARECIDD